MSQYPRLPEPPAPAPDQTIEQYGLAILAFIVREQVACTCTAEQLELALHIAPIASVVLVSGPKDARQVDYRTVTADAVADAKRLILATQRAARALATQPAATQPAPAAEQDGGSKVPRAPIPSAPAPSTYARPDRAPAPPAFVLNF